MTGLHLSHYRIDDELGRGGMGIVYRATDTKLNRTVALKVLPASALASEDDRARFFREAQAAAQIHHPNIATVFGIDEAMPLDDSGEKVTGQDQPRLFIAMEYIEGESLSDYIKKGPVQLQEAVNIAGQVAEALKEAHTKDIVHRDIKSANVMLTSGGVAKVLDFGLAKTNASTMLTRMGSTLGTVAYMSPEQARGQDVDGRTDLYSLGTMLYEMVAGKLPFAGDYEQAVLYSILNEPPEPLTAIRTGVPMQLEWVVSKLLSKEAEYRYQSAAGLLADLKSLDLSGSGVSRRSMAAMPAALPSQSGTPRWIWGALAGAVVVTAAVVWFLKPVPEPEDPLIARFPIELEFASAFSEVAWTADETGLYYMAVDTATGQEYLRLYDLQSGRSEPVPGTEDGYSPAVSPDGQWLTFYHDPSESLRRMQTAGGVATTLQDVPIGYSGFSTGDGFVVVEDSVYLILSDASTRFIGAGSHRIAHWFAEQERVFAGSPSAGTVTWTAGDSARTVLPDQYPVTMGPGGVAIVANDASRTEPASVAVFDVETGDVQGVLAPFQTVTAWGTTVISPSGHLFYTEAMLSASGTSSEPIARLSDGQVVGQTSGVGNEFSISPDGRFAMVEARAATSTGYDLYRLDLDTGAELRLTTTHDINNPEWSPDGVYVYYAQRPENTGAQIVRRRADGVGQPEIVAAGDSTFSFWSHPTPDGSSLVYTRGRDLMFRDLDSGEDRIMGAEGYDPKVSPDGRYVVQNSPHGDLLVTSIDGQSSIQLTETGYRRAEWAPDGSAIYYVNEGSSRLYRRPVTTEPVFAPLGSEEVVLTVNTHLHYDLMPDGDILYSTDENTGGQNTGRRIQQWIFFNFDDYARRVTGADDP